MSLYTTGLSYWIFDEHQENLQKAGHRDQMQSGTWASSFSLAYLMVVSLFIPLNDDVGVKRSFAPN